VAGASFYYFMSLRSLPWIVREGTVVVVVYSIAQGGVEISLPKIIGAIVMVSIVYFGVARFGYPHVMEWLARPVGGRKLAVRRSRA
jgi:hypothetical protein